MLSELDEKTKQLYAVGVGSVLEDGKTMQRVTLLVQVQLKCPLQMATVKQTSFLIWVGFLGCFLLFFVVCGRTEGLFQWPIQWKSSATVHGAACHTWAERENK